MTTKSEPDVDLERAHKLLFPNLMPNDLSPWMKKKVDELAAEFRAVRLEEAEWWHQDCEWRNAGLSNLCHNCKRIADLEASK